MKAKAAVNQSFNSDPTASQFCGTLTLRDIFPDLALGCTTVPIGAELVGQFLTADTDHIMTGVLLGEGDLTVSRAASVDIPDADGVDQEFGTAEAAWGGGRVTGAVGSRVVYDTDSEGVEYADPPWLAVTAGDSHTLDSDNLSNYQGALYAEVYMAGDDNIINGFLYRDTGNLTLDDGTTQVTAAMSADEWHEVGIAWSTVDAQMDLLVDGSWIGAVAYDGSMLSGALDLFRSAANGGRMRNLRIYSDGSELTGEAPTITTLTLDDLTYGEAFSQTLAATGTTPITWTVSAGTLPDGLNLSAAGEFTGTPTEYGAYDFTVQATNSIGNDTQQYTGAIAYSPAALFAADEQGAWLDPSDLSTLWQDTAGTTPVTAADQIVARIDDKSGNGNNALFTTESKRPILRESGGLYYLEVDGVNDAGSIATLDMSDSDKCSFFVAMRKDGAVSTTKLFYELSATANSNLNTFRLGTPQNPDYYNAISHGTASISTDQAAKSANVAHAAPHVAVLSGNHDISGDLSSLRVNGSTTGITNGTGDQGSGNFGDAYPLYLYGRAAASLYFTGRDFGLIIRSGLTSGDLLTATEQWLADKCGVTLP